VHYVTARSRSESCHVSGSDPIRFRYRKLPLHRVVGGHRCLVRALPFHPTVGLSQYRALPHQARDPVTARAQPLLPQGHMDTMRTIDVRVFGKDCANPSHQRLIGLAPKTGSSILAGGISGSRHFEDSAHRHYSELPFVFLDEPESHDTSFAKKIRLSF
jgi:hypothetical protein